MFNWNIKGEGRIRRIDAGIGGPEPDRRTHHAQRRVARCALHPSARPARVDGARQVARRLGHCSRSTSPTDSTIAGIADPEGNPVVLVQQ